MDADMLIWTRYSSSVYHVVARDDDFSRAEVNLAHLRIKMWPHHDGATGYAERADTLTRGLVETCLTPYTAIQCAAYPEAL